MAATNTPKQTEIAVEESEIGANMVNQLQDMRDNVKEFRRFKREQLRPGLLVIKDGGDIDETDIEVCLTVFQEALQIRQKDGSNIIMAYPLVRKLQQLLNQAFPREMTLGDFERNERILAFLKQEDEIQTRIDERSE